MWSWDLVDQFFADENSQVYILRGIGIVIALFFLLPFVVHKPGTKRKRIYRRYVQKSGKFYNRVCSHQIATFLDEIRQGCLVSGPKLTVVEIGPGPFPSFKAYPTGTTVVCIEPCDEFNRFIESEYRKSHLAPKSKEDKGGESPKKVMSASSSYSSLSGNEMANGNESHDEQPKDDENGETNGKLLIYNVPAERMVEVVGMKSVDVVVGRQVLCSVEDPPKVLEQISQVLKPVSYDTNLLYFSSIFV